MAGEGGAIDVWLRAGPVAIDVAGDVALPQSLLALARPHPGSALARARLRLARDRHAGEPGPVVVRGESYVGPGFVVTRRARDASFVARVAGEVEVGAAVAAVLIDLARTGIPLLLLHAAALLWREGVVLVIGASGAGKSSLVARHFARAVAANAVVAWPREDRWFAVGLPITGHGDCAVRPRSYRVRGVLALDRGPGPRIPLVSPTAHLASAEVLARGLSPHLDLIHSLAHAVDVRRASRCFALP